MSDTRMINERCDRCVTQRMRKKHGNMLLRHINERVFQGDAHFNSVEVEAMIAAIYNDVDRVDADGGKPNDVEQPQASKPRHKDHGEGLCGIAGQAGSGTTVSRMHYGSW